MANGLGHVVWITCKHFWEGTGVSGASNAGRARHHLGRLLWFVVFVVGLLLTAFNMNEVFEYYHTYPTDTTIKHSLSPSVRLDCYLYEYLYE